MATVSSLTQPLLISLSTASNLCAEIKKNRHCGSIHTQLDLLELSLLDGPSIITTQQAGLEDVVVSESTKGEFGRYATGLALICGRLESIAQPSPHHTTPHSPSKHHGHGHKHDHRSHSSHSRSSSDEGREKEHHHHNHHSNTKPLIFSSFEPAHHHHHGKEVEDPHFHEIREDWEGVRLGIGTTLEGLIGIAEGKGKVEEVVVEKVERVEIKEESGAIEEVIEKVKMVEITEEREEKVEVKEEEGAEIELVKEVVKEEGGEKVEAVEDIEVKEDGEAKIKVVKEEARHVDLKETEMIVVEVEEGHNHHRRRHHHRHHHRHEDDISPGDSGSEGENEERKILDDELKEMEAKAR
jgi:hypothetical protein